MAWWVRIGVAFVAAVAAGVAGAQPTVAQGETFGIIAQMPPGGLDVVDVQLLDEEGVDVLGLYCFEELVGYAQNLPGYRCDSVPDGTYTVAIGERPEGWIVSEPDCLPFVEDRSPSTFTVTDGQGIPGNCVFVASPPVLLMTINDFSGAVPDARIEVHDADGTVVELDCEPETRVGYGGEWCFGVPFGELTVSLEGPVEGYRSAVFCEPDLDLNSQSDRYGDSISLTSDQWYWSCSSEIVAPISIDFRDNDGVALEADDVRFTVDGPDGDVTDRCIEVPFTEEQGGLGESTRRFHCLGLGLGSYLVEPVSDRARGDTCVANVGPSLWGWCEFYLSPAPEPPAREPSTTVAVTTTPVGATTTTAPAASPDTAAPTGATPDDDSGGGWLVPLFAGLLGGVVGATLVVLVSGRRRS